MPGYVTASPHPHSHPAIDAHTHSRCSNSAPALQIPLAFMILLDPAFFKNTIWAGNGLSTLVMAISAGYFLYDTLEVDGILPGF